MSAFRNLRGVRTILSLPATTWAPFEKVKTSYARLLDERKTVNARSEGLAREREAAVTADRSAYAEAIRKGKADPGEQTVAAVDEQIAQTGRRALALELALDQAEEELVAVVEKHRGPWLAEQAGVIDTARADYQTAIEAAFAARARLSATAALSRFLSQFPDASYSTADLPFRGGLIARSGDPVSWPEVEVALRLDVDPPPAPQRQTVTGLAPISSIRVGDSDGHTRLLRPSQPTAPIRPAA